MEHNVHMRQSMLNTEVLTVNYSVKGKHIRKLNACAKSHTYSLVCLAKHYPPPSH